MELNRPNGSGRPRSAAAAAAAESRRWMPTGRKKAELATRGAACRTEQGRLNEPVAKGSAGSGMDDLMMFAATATCERLVCGLLQLHRFRADEAKACTRLRKTAEEARVRAEREKAGASEGEGRVAAIAAQKKQEKTPVVLRRSRPSAMKAGGRSSEGRSKAAEENRRADAAAARAAAEETGRERMRTRQGRRAERERWKPNARLPSKHRAYWLWKEMVCQAEQAKALPQSLRR